MTSFPRALSAQQELNLAQKLVELRAEGWSRLFAYHPYVAPLCARLEQLVDEGEDELVDKIKRLRKVGSSIRARSPQATVDKLDAARQELIELLAYHRHGADLFRRCSRAARGVSETPLRARKPTEGSRVFRTYLSELRKAESDLGRARQRFVASNLRLVVSVARRYKHPFLTREDLIQEGTLGLIRAVDGYDPRRGTRFSTYAAWWIKHGITRAIANHGLTIRVPANMLTLRAQLVRLEQQFLADHHRSPTNEELAKLAGAPLRTVAKARTAVLGQTELPHEGANLPDEQPVDVEHMLDWPVVEQAMLDRVEALPGIEASIIRHRFPLDGRPVMTLAQLGEVHSLSRERIRQIEKRALSRMRGQLQGVL